MTLPFFIDQIQELICSLFQKDRKLLGTKLNDWNAMCTLWVCCNISNRMSFCLLWLVKFNENFSMTHPKLLLSGYPFPVF
jgi:hypothetical protein